jgi:imidazolonepropionase-like amidohydrolase
MSAGKSSGYDLVVTGGTLVIPGVGQIKSNVAAEGGKIVALGEELSERGKEVFDARGNMVLPGIFDPHTHIGNEHSYEEEAETKTRAAKLAWIERGHHASVLEKPDDAVQIIQRFLSAQQGL